LHQKVKTLIKQQVVTIVGDNLCAIITDKGLVLEINHNCNDEELYNFEMMAVFETDKVPFNFDPYSNLNVNDILKKWGYFLLIAIQ